MNATCIMSLPPFPGVKPARRPRAPRQAPATLPPKDLAALRRMAAMWVDLHESGTPNVAEECAEYVRAHLACIAGIFAQPEHVLSNAIDSAADKFPSMLLASCKASAHVTRAKERKEQARLEAISAASAAVVATAVATGCDAQGVRLELDAIALHALASAVGMGAADNCDRRISIDNSLWQEDGEEGAAFSVPARALLGLARVHAPSTWIATIEAGALVIRYGAKGVYRCGSRFSGEHVVSLPDSPVCAKLRAAYELTQASRDLAAQ